MVRTLYANTFEIDDRDAAIEELLEQIDNEDLSAHSVGIVSCHVDYVRNGTIKALKEHLPFEFIGSTTSISSLCGEAGEDQLALLILTSDEASFACGVTEPLSEDTDARIAAAYDIATKQLSDDPVMGISIAPYLPAVSGDDQVRGLDKASGGIPFFGSIALDYVEAIRDPRTIYNGINYTECMTFILIAGAVDPEFFFIAIPESHFLKQKAIITSAEKNILKEVNEMPAATYLESLGLLGVEKFESIPSIPLSIDVGDGASPVARAIFDIGNEGQIICGGEMPEEAALGIGALDVEDVQNTAEELALNILSLEKKNGVLIFSCLSRNTALGLDTMLEIERIDSILGNKIPYLFMYSGGEFYPDIIGDAVFNKAHNFTMIACVF